MLNGEKNLGALFHSVVNQPIQPNQIVISDDGSSDGTIEIAINCMKDCSNISLLTLINQGRHGPTGNYLNAIQGCSGDIVFLADQDDVWLSTRCQEYLGFYANADVSLVAADSYLTNEDLCPLGPSLWKLPASKCVGEYRSSKYGIAAITKSQAVAHQLSFRSRCIPDVISLAGGFYIEDWCQWACELSGYSIFIRKPLTLYRQHHSQLTKQRNSEPTSIRSRSGPSRNALQEGLSQRLANVGAVREVFSTRLSQKSEYYRDPLAAKVTWINAHVDYIRTRLEFYESLAHVHSSGARPFADSRPFILYGKLLFRYYFPHGSGFLTAIKDGFQLCNHVVHEARMLLRDLRTGF
jgi:glycosyltransferase involved in cell wall biosynthesis